MTLIIFALAITTLFVITALVIDLSFVRQNRQADKSATDFAAAAGIRGMDDGSGLPNVWNGICGARDYLVANNQELSPLTHVDAGGIEITDPCLSPPTLYCTSTASWKTYRGTADDGRIRVTIHGGYGLPDGNFPEDDDDYSGDDGAASSTGCDHLAVIIDEREDPYFGGIAGSSGHETTIRSVGRLIEGTDGDVTAALILLERNDCQALSISGSNAIVRVLGNGVAPGVIHSDSLGNGGSCGKIFALNGNTPPPRIVAENAEQIDPLTSILATGQISTVARTDHPSAQPENDSDGIEEVCAQAVDSDCGNPTTGEGPSGRALVGRGRIDGRYLNAIIDLRNRATGYFAWSTSNPPPTPEWFIPPGGCDPTGPLAAPKVWIDCDGDFKASGKTFEATVEELVIPGTVKITGSSTFHFKGANSGSPTRVFIGGASGTTMALTGGNVVRVNDGDEADCDDRYASRPTARTELVVGQGDISTNGGVLRLCQTTVFMMDGSGASGACPLPDPDAGAIAPYDNDCGGKIRARGSGAVEWSAPNVKNTVADLPTAADFANFEDLAFWSETSAHQGPRWGIAGGNNVLLSGIFFTPNASPFVIGGTGSWEIVDAQFITRRLEIAGDAYLEMQPEPFNSIQIPALKGFTLVR